MIHYEKGRKNRSWIKKGQVWERAKMVEWVFLAAPRLAAAGRGERL